MSKLLTTTLLALGLALLCLPGRAQEAEPNNSFAEAQGITLGQAITGQVANLDDNDYYVLTLDEGAYQLTIDYPGGLPANRDWFTLYDEAQMELLEFFCYYPNGLHVALFKVCQPGEVYVRASANLDLGLSGAEYSLLVEVDAQDPAECNDSAAEARVLDVPGSIEGKIGIPGDVDMIQFDAAPGLFLASINVPGGSPDFELSLYADPNAAPILATVGGNLQTGLALGGTYYLRIAYVDGDTSTLAPYLASLAFLTPNCDLAVDTADIEITSPICGQANGSITIPVPTTGTAPFLYSLNGGDASPNGTFTDLPAGAYTVEVVDAAGCTYVENLALSCVDCLPPVAGINFVAGPNGISFFSVVQNGVVLTWNFGDGTTSTEINPTHAYLANGVFTVTLTAESDCGAIATASVEVIVLNGDFEFGVAQGVTGDTVYVALISRNYDGPITSVLAQLRFDETVGKLVGLSDGRLRMNTGVFNPVNNAMSFLFNASGAETVVPGDTLFLVAIELVGEPGDSSVISVTGGDIQFEITGLVGAVARPILGNVTDGGFSIYRDIPVNLTVNTPFGLPVSEAEVTIVTSDSTYVFYTDSNGRLETSILYSDALSISTRKDTIVRAGISPADAVYINRLVVQLPIPTLNPYTYLAADVDCNGVFTTLDVVQILQWLVGLIDFPCQSGQIIMVPASHQMPNYPDPGYFTPPTDLTLNNVDPAIGINEAFVAVVRADADGNAAPGFMQVDSRNYTKANWMYASYRNADGTTRVRINTDDQNYLGGLLEVQFNEGAEYVGYTWLGSAQAQVMANETYAQRGHQVKFAFIGGTDAGAGPQVGNGLLELIFAGDFVNLATREASQVYEPSGEILGIDLTALAGASSSTAEVSPNPSTGSIRVNWTNEEVASQFFQLFTTHGQTVFTAQVSRGETIDVALPPGMYIWKLADGKQGKLFIKN